VEQEVELAGLTPNDNLHSPGGQSKVFSLYEESNAIASFYPDLQGEFLYSYPVF
jgi:hypothetical protein